MGHKGTSHESSFMIKTKKKNNKKNMALFLKNIEHVKFYFGGVYFGGKIVTHMTHIKHVQFLLKITKIQIITNRWT